MNFWIMLKIAIPLNSEAVPLKSCIRAALEVCIFVLLFLCHGNFESLSNVMESSSKFIFQLTPKHFESLEA